eukprot:Em0019g1067a
MEAVQGLRKARFERETWTYFALLYLHNGRGSDLGILNPSGYCALQRRHGARVFNIRLLKLALRTEISVSLEVPTAVEWKCATTVRGEQCAMTYGITQMQQLFADSLVMQAVPEYRRTEVERAQYYSMMLAALGASPDCGSVQTVALVCITVSILRMQVSRAQLFVSHLQHNWKCASCGWNINTDTFDILTQIKLIDKAWLQAQLSLSRGSAGCLMTKRRFGRVLSPCYLASRDGKWMGIREEGHDQLMS